MPSEEEMRREAVMARAWIRRYLCDGNNSMIERMQVGLCKESLEALLTRFSVRDYAPARLRFGSYVGGR